MTVSDVSGRVKTAMVTAARNATAGLTVPKHTFGVSYGHPGKQLPDDVVSVTRVVTQQDPATLSANLRQRDLIITITVVVSVWRKGGADQEQVAGDRAYQLLDALEEYVRVTDTTLGGLVRWCFCIGSDSEGSTDPQLLATGRVIEITAQFFAKARITS